VPSTGGTPTMITQGGLPSFSPNGKSLAYIGNGSVFVAAASDGSGVRRIASGIPTTDALSPGGPAAWSQSSKQLAYSDVGDETSTSTAVGLVPVKGGMGVALPNLSAAAFSPSGLQLCAQSESGLVTASLGGTTIDVIVPAGATGDPVACAWTF
jgi:hypothetical protein